MRVLVTGGAGYIGSHTAKALSGAGLEPVVFDNLSTGHRRNARWGRFVEGDLSDRNLLKRVLAGHGIGAVIHFAANAYVGESMRNPRKYFRNNVINTLQLLDAMVDCGVPRIVFSSSCATYGNPERLPLKEDHPQRPISPYGESKLFCERAIEWYSSAYSLQWVNLRYFNAAGADPEGETGEDHDPETHAIPLMMQAAMGARAHFEVFGNDYPTPDGTAIRDYVHVADLADAHVRAVTYLRRGGKNAAVNLGTGRGHSVSEVIRAVECAANRTVPVVYSGRRAGDPAELVADPGKAGELFGWTPRHSRLETIARTAWNWHKREKEAKAGT